MKRWPLVLIAAPAAIAVWSKAKFVQEAIRNTIAETPAASDGDSEAGRVTAGHALPVSPDSTVRQDQK